MAITRFANLSIRTQLIVLAVLLTLPAVGIIVYSGLKERSDDYRHAVVESQRLADNLAAQQEILTNEAKLLCNLLAELPEVKNRDIDKLQAILGNIHKQSPQYINILVADAAGHIWASAVPVNKSDLVTDRRYFKSARQTKQFSAGEFVISKSVKKPTLHMAYPLLEHDEFNGVVIVGFDLDVMRTILDRAQLSQDANYVLVDHNGIIVNRGKDAAALIGKPIPPEALKKMVEGPDKDTFEFVRRDGDNRITTSRKLWLPGERSPYLYVRAGISKKEVLAKANKALLVNVSTLLLFVMLSFAGVFIIGKRSIVDRIAVLKRASQRLASGDLDFRVSDQISGGELGNLAGKFDAMARQLAVREQSLRESESNYRDIFNATHDALFVHDAESGEILEVNKSAVETFGYADAETLKASMLELSSGEPPYSPAEALQWINKTAQEGPQRFEWLSKRKNGELFWSEVTLTPMCIMGKKRVLAVGRDISERKEMEHLKEEMLSAVSHEMRTPLTAMLGFLQFIVENPVEEAEMREYLGIMHKEAERLNELINNFLEMQRLKAKRSTYNFQALAVRPLLEEAVALYSISSVNHRIIINSSAELPPVFGDESLLHQALVNLISNAIKYSPAGSVIDLGACRDENRITLWVKDEGLGIPPGSLDKVFDMFYRVNNKSSRQAPGTGLGLALVKDIVSAHDGRVWVESTLGQGSSFYISLPVAKGL
ncbi:MAG: PAS domain S-box protein [Desulfuromonas sp.]|nr:PAS domain S-box protein [Desulfuromonas sp.]